MFVSYGCFLVVQILSYFLVGVLSVRYSLNVWQPVAFWDEWVPFVPHAVGVYVMYLPLMAAPLFLKKPLQPGAFLRSMVMASGITYLLAFFVSVEPPPHAVLSENHFSASLWLVSLFYEYDIKGLYFPSLHVLHSGLIGLFFSEGKGFKHKLFWGLGVGLIAVSAVLVKQHFVWDILAALTGVFVLYKTSLKTKNLWRLK